MEHTFRLEDAEIVEECWFPGAGKGIQVEISSSQLEATTVHDRLLLLVTEMKARAFWKV